MRSIAHISDLHFGRLDAPVAEALVEELQRTPPSVIVVSGDFTQRARVGQYVAAAEYLKRLPRPQIVVPGNHDVPMYNVFRRFFFPLDRYLTHITADLSPAFGDNEIFVLGVNSARSFTQKGGWLSPRQLEEVCRRLSAAPRGLAKVLVTHHPFIPPPHDPRGDVLRRGRRTLEQLESCGIDLMLAGHLHVAYHDDIRVHYASARHSALSIQAGTATSTRRRGQPNSWNWIAIDGDSVTVGVRSWNGSAFVETRSSRYRRVGGVWTPAPENSPATAPAGPGILFAR